MRSDSLSRQTVRRLAEEVPPERRQRYVNTCTEATGVRAGESNAQAHLGGEQAGGGIDAGDAGELRGEIQGHVTMALPRECAMSVTW